MKKKFLSGLMALAIAIPCAFGLVGCGEDPADPTTPPATPPATTPVAEFVVADDILSNANAIITDIKTNIYNNDDVYGTETRYTVAEVVEKDADFVYYVNIGEVKNVDEVESISINDVTFEEDDTLDLSVGNSNFIADKAFYEEENNIYVATPIILFEAVNNSKIKINDIEFDFDLDVSVDEKVWESVTVNGSSASTVDDGENAGEYDVTFKDTKTMVLFYYDNADADDIILTRKVVTGSAEASLNGNVSYGFTTPETMTDCPLGYYPIGYYAGALTEGYVTAYETWYNGVVSTYDVYIVGVGVFKTAMNITIDLTATA